MLKQLPKTCNLHAFSFLSSTDIRNTTTVNKETKNLLSHPFVWKNLLKTEFFLPHWKEMKDPEQKHRDLTEDAWREREKFITYITAVLFLQEIKEREIAHIPPVTREISLEVILDQIAEHKAKFNKRLYKLDGSLICSFQDFLNKYEEYKQRFPDIDETKIREAAKKIVEGNQEYSGKLDKFSEIMTYALFKLDLPILARGMLNHAKLDKESLNKLLSIACGCLSLSTAKLLIEFGAGVNDRILFVDPYGEISQVTCLWKAVRAIRVQCIVNAEPSIEKGKELFQLLLDNAADPDVKCLVIPEDVDIEDMPAEDFDTFKTSIRESCTRTKADNIGGNFNYIPIEILDLIISAPTLQPDEMQMNKMRI